MDSQANYRLVGAFIILISILIIVSLLWLTNLGESRNATYYTIYFRNYSLSGLQKDSYVTMKGIHVGSVVNYKISPRSVEEVKVTIRLDPQTPVMTTTEAIVTRNLLTGLAAVELTGAKDTGELLLNIPTSEEYPVIPEGKSTFEQIADSMPELLENVSEMVRKIGEVFSDQNITSLQNTLTEIEKFSRSANTNFSGVDEMIREITMLSKNVSATSKDVSALARNSSEDLTLALQELKEGLAQLRQTFAEIEKQTEVVANSVVGTSQVLSQQVITVGQSLSEAAESVSQTAESFENPRSIISGPSERALGPGERLAK